MSVKFNALNCISAFPRTLTVENPAVNEAASQWLRNKSQTELWALVQHGNPQEIIPYSIALTSKLNQVACQSKMFIFQCMCHGEFSHGFFIFAISIGFLCFYYYSQSIFHFL